jgi:glycosyltransferase involved in cell wall biosynthesis
MDPLITVITVSLNSEKTILNCLESINSQTYSNYEHLIIDGESKDKTIEIIQGFSSNKIRFISEKDNGLYDAMNKGLRHSKGEIIGFLNSDDIFFSKNILEIISKKMKDEKIDATYGDLLIVNNLVEKKPKRLYKSKNFSNKLFKRCIMPPHPTFYFKSKFLEKIGFFNLSYKVSSDFDFVLRCLVKHNLRAKYIDNILVIMSSGGISNRGLKAFYNKNKDMFISARKNGLKNTIFDLFLKIPMRISEIFIYKYLK